MVKRLIRSGGEAALRQLPFSMLRTLASFDLVLPLYHVVSDAPLAHAHHLFCCRDTRAFKEDLDFFLKNYSPLSLNDLIDALKNEEPIAAKSFLLTFDDGFREVHDVVAPILKEKGVPAVFFLCPAFLDNKRLFYRNKASILVEAVQGKALAKTIEREVRGIFLRNGIAFSDFKASMFTVSYHQQDVLDEIALKLDLDFSEYLRTQKPYLSSDQVEALKRDGFAIGAHSIDHPCYAELSLEEQLGQTIESATYVKQRFSLEYGAFAFPFNDFGVSRRFFEEISRSGCIDVSFGSGRGMQEDIVANHVQRFSMESNSFPAQETVERFYRGRFMDLLTAALSRCMC